MLAKVVMYAVFFVLVNGCGIENEKSISSTELPLSDIHRSYQVVYNDDSEETTYTAEFSRRNDGTNVVMANEGNISAQGFSLLSVLGATSGVYSLKSDSGYEDDDIVFEWTEHSVNVQPDTFPAPYELNPVPTSIQFQRGFDLVVRLDGPQEIAREEKLTAFLANRDGAIIPASKVSRSRATFRWDLIQNSLNNNGWFFFTERAREIKREENAAAGQVGTCSFQSVYRSRIVPVTRGL